MVTKLENQKATLAASIGERMRADGLVKFKRPAPPSAQRIATVHRILGPKPTPAPAPAVEPAEPMAKKKKKWTQYTDEYKAQIVARALKGRESGKESVATIAVSEGLHRVNIDNWIKAAKKADGAPGKTTGKADSKAPSIKSLSRDLTEAMSRVVTIKKQLRKLLDVD